MSYSSRIRWFAVVLSVLSIPCSQAALAQASSAEAVNPFNEYMSPMGGLNLFSGDAAVSHPLHTLTGVAGLQVPLTLNYSGNVHLNVRAREDRAKTDWVGLGWRFGFGSVRCEHGNTGNVIDDRCYYTSPKGVSQEILEKPGTGTPPGPSVWRLEKDPYWKVDPVPSADGRFRKGWTLTDPSGRVFRYGDFADDPSLLRNATRYVFWWRAPEYPGIDYVGSGHSGNPRLYPFQWDLAEEIDLDGNTIKYSYEQDQEAVRRSGVTLAATYTKASYLKTISVPGGGSVEFFRRPKTRKEIYDPETFSPEPDAFMEFLEKDYLDSILIRNPDGAKLKRIRFGYKVANYQKEKAAGYAKRFLTRITEETPAGDPVGTHLFEYSRENPEDESLPLGTLSGVQGPSCGKVTYKYTRLQIKGSQKVMPGAKLGQFREKSRIMGGQLTDGGEYLLVSNGNKDENESAQISIFNNEDGEWKEHFVRIGGVEKGRDLGLTAGKVDQLIAGEGFFIVVKKVAGNYVDASIFRWTGDAWVATEVFNRSMETWSDFLVVHDRNVIVMFRSLLRGGVYTGWIHSFALAGGKLTEETYTGEVPVSAELKLPHLSVTVPNGRVVIMTFTGQLFEHTYDLGVPIFGFMNSRLGENLIYQLGTNGVDDDFHDNSFIGTHWDGHAWRKSYQDYIQSRLRGANFEAAGSNYAVSRSDDQDHLHLFQFTGDTWQMLLNRNMVQSDWDMAFEAKWKGTAFGDALIVRSPRTKWHLFWKEIDRDAKVTAFNRMGKIWKMKEFGLFGYPNTSKKVVVGQDFWVHNTNPGNGWVWNGTEWVEQHGDRRFKTDAMSLVSANVVAEKVNGEISLYRKIQNSLHSPVYAFVVSSKEIFDPVRGKTSSYIYEYDNSTARFDFRTASAKFHNVTALIPDHGRKSFWFHNGHTVAGDAFNPPGTSRRLLGNLFRERSLSSDGKPVSETRMRYQAYQDPAWPEGTVQIRLMESEGEDRKVPRKTVFSYNPVNGIPERTEEIGSNGRRRISRTVFAHQVTEYAGVIGKHMLTQIAETRVYQGSEIAAGLASSNASIWGSDLSGRWHKSQDWAWNGTEPATSYAAFRHDAPSQNGAAWKLQGSVSLRDTRGRPVETSTPKGSLSCFLFGDRGFRRVAEVAGAGCAQVALLTGDYDDPGAAYLDQEQQWMQNDATRLTGSARFGSGSLRIPPGGRGPSKSAVQPAAGRDYVFSAWVYPVAVSPASPVALSVKLAGGVEAPGRRDYGDLQPGATHGWQRIERKIPSADLGTGAVSVSVDARGIAEFRVQDIRFLPAGALATTRYHDPVFTLPTATVSPTGSSQQQEYDGAMRVIRTFGEDGSGRKVLRSEAEYHLDQCGAMAGPHGDLSMLRSPAAGIVFRSDLRDYGDLWVDPMLETVPVEFLPLNPHDRVTVRVDGGPWQEPCCRGEGALDLPLAGATTVLEIRAGQGAPYRLAFRKPTSCWSSMGSQVSGGWGGGQSARVAAGDAWTAYRGDQDGGRLFVKRWSAANNSWSDLGGAVSVGTISKAVLEVVAGTPYVAYLDKIPAPVQTDPDRVQTRAVVKRWSGSAWLPVAGDGVVSLGNTLDLAFAAHENSSHEVVLWLAFIGDPHAEEGRENRQSTAYVRKWESGQWRKIGDFIEIPDQPETGHVYHGDGVADGRVSDGKASAVSLALHPDGTPHIAYLGSVRAVAPGGGTGLTRSGGIPVVKKLVTQDAEVFWGDLKAVGGKFGSQGEAWARPHVERLQLAFGGTDLHVAALYRTLRPSEDDPTALEASEDLVLDVRKYRSDAFFADGSRWFPLASGTTPAEYVVTPMDEESDFHFDLSAGTPTLAFTNAQNSQRVTVLEFAGGRWKAMGNPAFLAVDLTAQPGRIAVATGSGANPLLVMRQDREESEAARNAIRALAYTGTCPDLTLAALSVHEGARTLPLEWAYRPYLLHHRGNVSAQATAIGVSVTPANPSAVSRIWIASPDGSSQEWSAASGTPLPTSFPVTLRAGENTIQVEVVSADGRYRLRYQVDLGRELPITVEGTVLVRDFVLHPGFSVDNPGPYTILVPANRTSIQISVDISRNVDVFIDGRAVDNRERIEINLSEGTTRIVLVLVGPDGTRREYEIQVDRGTPSIPIVPLLAGVTANGDGTYTARFGYANPNPGARQVPVGTSNSFRYRGQAGLDMGQPVSFLPGTVTEAFSAVFDGTPLTWALEGGTVTATAGMAAPGVFVEMKDNGLSESNISKPQIRLTNRTTSALAGFKVSLWLSRAEVPYQEIVADPYYFNPSGIQMSASPHPANANLVRIDLRYPAGFSLAPGASTDDAGIQLGAHFRYYYPGQWNRANDWSWQGVGAAFAAAPFVTVYSAAGALLAGLEPDPGAVPVPPVLDQAALFSLDEPWPWQSTVGGLSRSTARKTQGSAGLQVEGVGYMEVTHMPLSTTAISGESSRLRVDFYLPSGQSNPWWKGQVQLFADCPSASQNNVYLGAVELTPLPSGAFSTLEFTLTPDVLAALRASHPDFRFKWILNVNQASEHPVLDNMRFAP
jgi:hypothetical protein